MRAMAMTARLCPRRFLIRSYIDVVGKTIGQETQDHLSVFGREDMSVDFHTSIRQKDEIYSKLYKSVHMQNAGPHARLKFAMDYWCALWFWPIHQVDLLPSRREFLNDMSLILEGTFTIRRGGNLLDFQHNTMPGEPIQRIIE